MNADSDKLRGLCRRLACPPQHTSPNPEYYVILRMERMGARWHCSPEEVEGLLADPLAEELQS
jgi:hypothetical protein